MQVGQVWEEAENGFQLVHGPTVLVADQPQAIQSCDFERHEVAGNFVFTAGQKDELGFWHNVKKFERTFWRRFAITRFKNLQNLIFTEEHHMNYI